MKEIQIILSHSQIEQKIVRLAYQILENCFEEKSILIGGIQGNGQILAKKISSIISDNSNLNVLNFELQINKEEPWREPINLTIESSKIKDSYIIVVDDVVNSGKTLIYALNKILEHPTKAIKTVTLVDRQHRRYPVKTDFKGLELSTTLKDRIEVDFNEDESKAFLV